MRNLGWFAAIAGAGVVNMFVLTGALSLATEKSHISPVVAVAICVATLIANVHFFRFIGDVLDGPK